jgi:predicted phosphodiesterase
VRFAVISDVHGNLPALESVLDALKQEDVDRIVCTGDIVGLGPYPNEVIDLLRRENVEVVIGNYDDAVAYGRVSSGMDFLDSTAENVDQAAIGWTRERLTPENLAYLRALPRDVRLTGFGRRIQIQRNREEAERSQYRRNFIATTLFGGLAANDRNKGPRRHSILVVHGSPRALNEFIWPDSANSILSTIATLAKADVIVSGHAGVSFDRNVGNLTFIGVGSVSGTRATPGEAEYAVIEASGGQVAVTFKRVTYDPRGHVQAIVDEGLPPALAANFDLSGF